MATAAGTNVTSGPYPTRDDFQKLKDRHIELIVSLLNPQIPYEAQLLADEQKNAADFGIEVRDFPMSSILGQSFGSDYEKNAAAAAALINATKKPVYVHCYLGLHRVNYVIALAQSNGSSNKTFVAQANTDWKNIATNPDFQKASDAYKVGDYAGVIRLVTQGPGLDPARKNLLGWSHYQIGHTEQSMRIFSEVLAENPTDVGAQTGYGYGALRLNHLGDAIEYLSKAHASNPNDSDVLIGLATAHLKNNSPAQARVYAQEALKINPENKDAITLLKSLN